MQYMWWFYDQFRSAQDAFGINNLFLCTLAAYIVAARWLLRLPYGVIAAALCAPAVLFVIDHPYSQGMQGVDVRVLLAGAWLVSLLAAFALLLLYSLFRLLNPYGPRATPLVALSGGACIVLVALIWHDPKLLEGYLPGWRSTWGLACIAAAGVTLTTSCIRCFRFAVPLVFWSAASVGLGGYIFYDKTPSELWQQVEWQEVLSIGEPEFLPPQYTPEPTRKRAP